MRPWLPAALALLLAPAAAFCQAGGETTKQAMDRTGEPFLKEVLASMAAQRGVMWTTTRLSIGSQGGAPEKDGQVDLHWDGPEKFRVQHQGIWGDAALMIRNGPAMLRDPLTKGEAAVLLDAGSDLRLIWSSRQVQDFGLFPLLLWGQEAMPMISPSAGSVTVREAGANRRLISSTGSVWGRIELLVRTDGRLQVERVSRVREGRFGSVTEVEEISESSPLDRRLPKAFFSTQAESGVALTDERKKPGG